MIRWFLKVIEKCSASDCSQIHRAILAQMPGGGSYWPPAPPPPLWFVVSSKEKVKPRFFVTFNIILKHVLPENFIEFTQVVQKIWKNSLSILVIFINFLQFFWIFGHYLVTKKLMTSAYNRCCHYFFTFTIR